MKKIGFMGAFDKSNFITYAAKVLNLLDYKVLVVDTTSIQKMKYIIPSINPTKSYITSFENIDFAIGFENWTEVERYLGIQYDTNDDNQIETKRKDLYDFVLIDIDSKNMLEKFDVDSFEKKYFVTSFDTFALKKGVSIFQDLQKTINLTKIEFTYETSKEDEEYLNYISLEYNINWNDYILYFQIMGEDNKVFEENQRLEKIKFKKLSINYKESLSYVIQDICKTENINRIKKVMKD